MTFTESNTVEQVVLAGADIQTDSVSETDSVYLIGLGSKPCKP